MDRFSSECRRNCVIFTPRHCPRRRAIQGGESEDGGTILSFAAEVPAEEKADVPFSVQFAQRAANARHDRFSEAGVWSDLAGSERRSH
jgi:hypothetical protein